MTNPLGSRCHPARRRDPAQQPFIACHVSLHPRTTVPVLVSNGPSGGQIMLIAKRLKNYTGYVTTKSTRSGSRHQPTTKHNLQYRTVRVRLSTWQSARAIACGTSTRTIVSLYVSDLLNVTKSTVLVRTRVFRLRLPVTDNRTNEHTSEGS